MEQVVAITGGNGRLGRRLQDELRQRAVGFVAPARCEVDWSRPDQARAYLAGLGPAKVVALASYTDVAGAETSRHQCMVDTVETARNTAQLAKRLALPMLYVSTDYVVPLLLGAPGGVYARAKLAAEQEVIKNQGHVVRMAFTTPEQVRSWGWANDFTLSNRWWVEDAASALAEYLTKPARNWRAVEELGPRGAVTPAQLLRGRYPDHPALADLVTDPEDMRARVGFAAPQDTRFHWCAKKDPSMG